MSPSAEAPSAPGSPATMRAWLRTHCGQPRRVLKLHPSLPTPAPPRGANVIVRVSFVALNPADIQVITSLPDITIPFFPSWSQMTPGLEFSGTIEQAGPNVPVHLKKQGTAVFGFFSFAEIALHGKGGLAEYVSVQAGNLVVIGEGTVGGDSGPLGLRESCALNGAGQVAVKMVDEYGKLGEGMKVLVNGASGGVGSFVVQLAKARGAYVVALCSERNWDMVKGFGADEVVDYRVHDPLTTHLASAYGSQPFDIILDAIGVQSLYLHSPKYLKPAGIFINVGNMMGAFSTTWNWFTNSWTPSFLGGVPRRYAMFPTSPNLARAEKLAALVKEEKINVVIDEEFAMENLLEGYDKLASNRTRGKLIVKIRTHEKSGGKAIGTECAAGMC